MFYIPFHLGRKRILIYIRVFLVDPVTGIKIQHLCKFSINRINAYHDGETRFLSNGSIGILGQIVLCCGGVSCTL